jgi:hypothetical protein
MSALSSVVLEEMPKSDVRLAGAVRAEQGEHLAAANRQVQAIHRDRVPLPSTQT